jgi:hypothetical protein
VHPYIRSNTEPAMAQSIERGKIDVKVINARKILIPCAT